MEKHGRRTFLRNTALAGGTAFALQGLVARGGLPILGDNRAFAQAGSGGYGPLAPRQTENTGETLLALPEGFKYTVFGKTGTPMSDGNPTPAAHDGMAAFAVNGLVHLVRNHEIRNNVPAGTLPPDEGQTGLQIGDRRRAYDAFGGGGTTTLAIDPVTRTLAYDFISASGTLVNCAGGPTPWGSWITCEETTAGAGGRFLQPHGYNFEVSAASFEQVRATPLKAMGRFIHEAIAVDPATGIVYQTEDAGNTRGSGFYRFIPNEAGNLAAGGHLQMLAVAGRSKYDTRNYEARPAPQFVVPGSSPRFQVGESLPIVWVDIANPDPANAEADPSAVFNQGFNLGGTVFARLEGCWYGDGSIFLNATSGGNQNFARNGNSNRRIGYGQVFQYTPDGANAGTLTLLFESPGPDILDAPDNICVSPRGGLVLCEDGDADQLVRGLTRDGRIFDVAKNIVPGIAPNGDAFSEFEFAGATFSPDDGQTLFFNIQTPGLTFAVWGPWENGAL